MDITKCDLCKKEIKDSKSSVIIRFASYKHADLCGNCASPILKFLKKNKFIDKKDVKKS